MPLGAVQLAQDQRATLEQYWKIKGLFLGHLAVGRRECDGNG
jgi:hypothetical protein